MSTANINVRIDPDVKKEAERLFDEIGLTMSAAINMFLKSAISYEGIPFPVKRMTPNATTLAAAAEYSKMLEDPQTYKRYDSFDEAMSDIFADA